MALTSAPTDHAALRVVDEVPRTLVVFTLPTQRCRSTLPKTRTPSASLQAKISSAPAPGVGASTSVPSRSMAGSRVI